MKAVIQRVIRASVEIDGSTVGEISRGLVLLLGVEKNDTKEDASWLMAKIVHLRIFEDLDGKMNLSVLNIQGSVLAVSQFTLAGNCSKGRRPSFDSAALPEDAYNLYQYAVEELQKFGCFVATGVFQANMQVHLINDGPVTFILDSKKRTSAGC